MNPCLIALTALTDQIRMEELARVAGALQTQVERDFAPIWGTTAIIVAVAFEAIPAGYCPIIVQDTLEGDCVNGFHRTRGDDSPYVIIPYGSNWSLAASHELLRMLANPTGSARRPGLSCMPGQGVVEYLFDVCAPCQDISSAYAIDGVVVSDFCTEAFFAEHGHATGRSCSFTGALTEPLRPSPDGIVTWLADDGMLYQARATSSGHVRIHGGFSPANRGKLLLRELIDLLTPDRLSQLSTAPRPARLQEADQAARRGRLSNLLRFRDDIAWRFGHATCTADFAAVSDASARRKRAYGSDKSTQQPASDERRITARTAS